MLYGVFKKIVGYWVVCVLCFSIIASPSSPLRHHPFQPTSTKTLIPSLPPLTSDSKLTLRFSDIGVSL
ncbi:hypothetical protein Hdeb2414_s0003g00097581 [Helianthus debilis subsp. tardiflorus]